MNGRARLVVGLTGGIGAGKSLAATCFSELGVGVVDADEVARELVTAGSPLLGRITAEFGDSILDAAGALDRRRLRTLVFADHGARARLEALLHPAIRARMARRAASVGGTYTLLVVPLLLEGEGYDFVDRILVIDAPPERQVERVCARDGCSETETGRIIAAQIERGERLARADDVIENDGSPGQLRAAVERMHRKYLRAAARRSLRRAENQ